MMKLMRLLFTTLLLITLYCEYVSTQTKITNLRTEYIVNPIGLNTHSPRFTWTINSSNKGYQQESFQIQVSSSPELLNKGEADIWKSEKIKDPNSLIIYNGEKKLQSHTKYYWRVKVWEHKGDITLSPISSFEMAKINKDDWKAEWISDNFSKEFRKSPLLRKDFHLNKKIKQARAYVSGVGYYVLYINGQRVGDHWLDPGYTDYSKRVLYVTYDVGSLLQQGDNVVSAVLGNGWFNIQSLAVWEFHNANWRDRPALLCEIRIEYEDGSIEILPTDSSWKTNTGPFIFNNLYSGEIYDARLEKVGWTNIGYDDKIWEPARVKEAPSPKIVSQQMPPIRITKEIKPVEMKSFPNNIWVFKMERNMSGFCRIKVKGEQGTQISISYGELVDSDGRLNQANIDIYFQREKNGKPVHKDPNEKFQTDIYYLKGDKIEEFTPFFTYKGFQYVEIKSSKPIEIDKESVTGLFLHTDVKPVGSFTCSNETLNKLVEASLQSYLSNLHSIPTDCPQREKNGWSADGYISMDLGLLYFDGITFYEKWLNDFADNQRERGNISGIIPSSGWGFADWIGPVWDAGMFIIPNNLYLYYGDKRAITNIYSTLEKYLKYLKTREVEGKLTFGIGDWVFYKTKTPTDFTSTAFYYLDNKLMSKFAKILGKDDDVLKYEQKATTLKELINKTWFISKSGIYATGTQAGQAVALALGLVPEESENQVAKQLVEMIRKNNHQLDFGMLGSKFVPSMLSKYGYVEDAYLMITKKSPPSWSNWIEQGLTTLPETWVLKENYADASLNHVFLGDISAWMTNTIAGINYDVNQPAFKHIIFRPHFIKDLDWAKGEYLSVNGVIKSEWYRESGYITYSVEVPSNSTATIYIDKIIELQSGNYTYKIKDKSY